MVHRKRKSKLMMTKTGCNNPKKASGPKIVGLTKGAQHAIRSPIMANQFNPSMILPNQPSFFFVVPFVAVSNGVSFFKII